MPGKVNQLNIKYKAMKTTVDVFDEHVAEYEEWFEHYPFVFRSEIEAVREMMPVGESLSGIEIGLGTGRYSKALDIKEGIEPSQNMRALANKRGIETMDAVAEKLPYADMRFDFVLMLFCVSYLDDIKAAFKEAYRVLKRNGSLIVGFIDRDSTIGKAYDQQKPRGVFYKHATFYPVSRITEDLKLAGFRHLEFNQTLFGDLESIQEVQIPKRGSGEGSFVVVRALKKSRG